MAYDTSNEIYAPHDPVSTSDFSVFAEHTTDNAFLAAKAFNPVKAIMLTQNDPMSQVYVWTDNTKASPGCLRFAAASKTSFSPAAMSSKTFRKLVTIFIFSLCALKGQDLRGRPFLELGWIGFIGSLALHAVDESVLGGASSLSMLRMPVSV